MTERAQLPAIEGWYTMDARTPHLLGSQCVKCGTYYFPKQSHFCRNPDCDGEEFKEVPLSRTGKVWSYTNACYQPPEPYIAADPYVPYSIAAVELAKEKMIVLGQVVAGISVEQLKVGMDVELVLEKLHADGDADKVTWKWRPIK